VLVVVVRKAKLGAKGQKRRVEVLSVAREVLLRDGVDKLILRKVATLTDIKLGHLQYYFPTRDDLLEAIFCEAWEEDRTTLGGAETTEGLEAVIVDLFDGWSGDRGKLYLLLTMRSFYDSRFKVLKRKIYLAFYKELMRLLKKIHPNRPKREIINTAKVITAFLDGATLQIHTGSDGEVRKQQGHFITDLYKAAIDLALQ
jgi:DNA-binding transcriptional regulator YbjK